MTIITSSRTLADPQAFKGVLNSLLSALDRDEISREERVKLYQTSVALYAAATWWADNVAQVEWSIETQAGERVADHPLYIPLRENMWRLLYWSEITRIFWPGNLIYKKRGVNGKTYALQWINPNLWQVDVDAYRGLKGFRILTNSTRYNNEDRRYIPARDAIYMHGLDFDDDFSGVAPAEVAFLHAGLGVELTQTALSFFRNRMLPYAIVQPDKDDRNTDANAAAAMANFLRRTVGGAINAGRTIVTPKRWEWLTLQQDFKELPIREFDELVDKAVEKATGVYSILISPDSGGFAVAEVARRTWGHAKFTPRLNWYGIFFTEGLASEYPGNLRIVPVLEKLDFLKEDQASLTNVVNAQVQAGYLSLYEAQRRTHHKDPDERLKDLYMIGGRPVPITEIATLWRQPGNGAGDGAGHIDDEPTMLPSRPQIERRLPDDVYTELKNWQIVASKRKKSFTPRVLMDTPTADFVAEALDSDHQLEDIFTIAKAVYLDELTVEQAWEQLEALRSIDDYRRSVRGLVRGYWSGQLSKFDFVDGMHIAINRNFKQTWNSAGKDVGREDGEFADEELEILNREINTELTYVIQFANDIEEGSKENGGKLAPLLARAELWVNTINRIYNLAKLVLGGNRKQRWKRNPLKDSCDDCIRLDGRVYYASTWHKYGIQPQSRDLACGGHQCGCGFEDTDDPVTKGRPPRLRGRKSHHLPLITPGAKGMGQPGLTVIASVAWDRSIITIMSDAQRVIGQGVKQWIPPAQYHMTLVSAKLVEDEQVEPLIEQISDQMIEPFSVRIGKLGMFEQEQCNVLILEIEPSEQLQSTQKMLFDAFEALQIPVSEHSQPEQYKPHITLAYVGKDVSLPDYQVTPVDITVGAVEFTRAGYETVYQVEWQ